MSNDNPDYNVGKVLEVSETWAGSEVTQDYASGSTVLEVYSTLDYSDQGGDVIIDGVVYPYNTKDDDDSTISLASALTVGISQDEEVLIYPLAKVKEAMVQIDDEDADLIRVPQSLYDALPLGIRLPADQETVLVSAYGDSEILDIVNQEVLRDGSYINPATLPASGSDGLPPGPVGVVTIHGGIEMLFLSWDAVSDAEVVTYDVHIDTVAGFTPGPINLAGSTDATVFNINLAPGTYYAQVIARDSDGPAAPSAEVSDTVIASVDVAAIQAQVDANAAAVKERPRVIFAATQPTLTADEKAVWYDTSNGYAASYWDGTAWGPYSLGTGAIAANAVTSNLLASNAVTTAKIAANAVTTAQIVADAVTAAQIATGAVTSSELANGAVIAGKIGALAITAAEIAASAITTAKIAADAVTAGEIASGAVGSGELAAGAVIAGKIAAGTIQAADIAAGAITAGKIAADAVTATEIAAGAVTASEVAAGAITAEKLTVASLGTDLVIDGGFEDGATWTLANGATIVAAAARSGGKGLRLVASGGIQATARRFPVAAGDVLSITAWAKGTTTPTAVYFRLSWRNAAGSEIGITDSIQSWNVPASWTQHTGTFAAAPAGAVNADFQIYNTQGAADVDDIAVRPLTVSAQIADGAITAAKIIAGAITAGKIAAGTIQAADIASGAITAGKIAADAVTATEIAASSVGASEIVANSITASQIAALAITTSELAADSVVSAKIAAGTIVASDVATDTLTAGQIAANAITSSELTAGAVTAVKIAAGSITANEIAAGTITATQIAAGTITGTQIAAGTITASQLSATAIDGKTITGVTVRSSSDAGNMVEVANLRVTFSSSGYTAGYITSSGALNTSELIIHAQNGEELIVGSDQWWNAQINGGMNIQGQCNVGPGGMVINGTVSGNAGITCDSNGTGGGFVDGNYIGGGSTTASVNNNGRIIRTSTVKMKKNLKPMTREEAHTVLGLESYTFQFRKGEHDQFEDPRRYPGFTAEQAAKAGAELWVARQHDVQRDKKTGEVKKITRNKQGEPIGFRTGDVTVAHNVLIKELFEELEALKAEVASLK